MGEIYRWKSGETVMFDSETGKKYGGYITKENARELGAKGNEAKRRKKAEEEGLKKLAKIAEQLLKKPVKPGNIKDLEELESLVDLSNANMTVAATGMARMMLGFVNGDKRSTSQLMELLALVAEEKAEDTDDGFLEALQGAAEDEEWDETESEQDGEVSI